MQCTNPSTIRNPKYDFGRTDQPQGLLVPCGKCMACRIARTREWTVRMMNENTCHEQSVYVTLTYNDEFLPKNLSLSKREAQLFLKRLRKSIEPLKIKYYLCGEYGEEYSRPHYHAIIFGLGIESEEIIKNAWPFGFIKLGYVEHDSIQYVSGYIQKKFSGKLGLEVYGDRLPPFHLQSKGLGKEWAIRNQRQLEQQLTVTSGGVAMGLPRYYKKILNIDSEKTKVAALEKEKAFEERALKKGAVTEVDKAVLREESRIQTNINLVAKSKLYSRKGVND